MFLFYLVCQMQRSGSSIFNHNRLLESLLHKTMNCVFIIKPLKESRNMSITVGKNGFMGKEQYLRM